MGKNVRRVRKKGEADWGVEGSVNLNNSEGPTATRTARFRHIVGYTHGLSNIRGSLLGGRSIHQWRSDGDPYLHSSPA